MMFTSSSSRGSELLAASRSDILRGIITEKLSTAAREILAVVERTVADYEEEASGFRQEIDRQRRQLELLQPQVRLHRGEPNIQEEEVLLVGEEPEEQQLQTGEDKPALLDFLWYKDDDDDDGDEGERPPVEPTTSFRKTREDLKDPDFQIPSRLHVPSQRRRPGRPRSSDTRNYLTLRVRVLQDSQTQVLSTPVFKKNPVQDLKCPLGLSEADFLDLLRSTFPQLANDEPFDLFLSAKNRRLRPLVVRSVTPEEIDAAIRSCGQSALYVRLKKRLDDEGPSVPAPTSSPGGQPEKRRRGRPRLGEEPSHYFLRLCVLEAPQSEAASEMGESKTETPRSPAAEPQSFPEHRSSSVLDLKCPRGLQEGEFVHLLRSSLPQLAGDDTKFHIYRRDRSKKLTRLRVKTLTPEGIFRSWSNTGVRKSLLYIKLKTGDDEEEEEEEDEHVSTDGAMMETEAGLSSSPGHSERKQRRTLSFTSALQEDLDPDEEAAESRVAEQDDEWKPDPDEFLPTERQTSRKLMEKRTSRESCKVCGFRYTTGGLVRHAYSHLDRTPCICAVCGESFGSSNELANHLQSHKKTNVCSFCGKAFITVSGLNNHMSLHTGNRPHKCNFCSKAFNHESSLMVHRWVHMEEKPHKCDLCSRSFGLKAQLTAHRKWHAGKFICHICGRALFDRRSLTRHKMTHSNERRFSCKVCGKGFKLEGTLRSHEKIHTHRERSYLCHVCCKTFFCNSSLVNHMKTHSGERPFVCSVCEKSFLNMSDLRKHTRVHTGEAPYGCSECGRFFKLKSTLNSHILTHTGVKRFICGVCGKACARQEHLTVHMRTHNGERPYKCTICEKDFTQSHCLKTHMKTHQITESPIFEPSTSETTLS